MFNQAISYAMENDASIVQLTTNKKRPKAKHFYEKLGLLDLVVNMYFFGKS